MTAAIASLLDVRCTCRLLSLAPWCLYASPGELESLISQFKALASLHKGWKAEYRCVSSGLLKLVAEKVAN